MILVPYTGHAGELLALGFTYITQDAQKSSYPPARMIYRGPMIGIHVRLLFSAHLDLSRLRLKVSRKVWRRSSSAINVSSSPAAYIVLA